MTVTTTVPLLHQDGHLQNHLDWTEAVAQSIAQQLHDLQLTTHHLQILLALREFYQRFDHAPATRPLIKYLQQTVDPQITNARLMAEFRTGTVARSLARLAGLPKPANCL